MTSDMWMALNGEFMKELEGSQKVFFFFLFDYSLS